VVLIRPAARDGYFTALEGLMTRDLPTPGTRLQLGYGFLPSIWFKPVPGIPSQYIPVQNQKIARTSLGRVLGHIDGYWGKLLRQLDSPLAKVGVEDSNPFARSKSKIPTRARSGGLFS